MMDLLLSSAGVPAFAFCADAVKGEQFGAAHPPGTRISHDLPCPDPRNPP
jgi:hypothetical protein